MKKTYLIKDIGKGLVENLTPDKLFYIASGNANRGWIDGKPIYRRVIELNNNSPRDISPFIPDFEKIIKSDFITYIDGKEYRGNILSGSPMAGYIEYTNTTEFTFRRWADNTIILTDDIEFELFEKIQIIVEYTKTTD